MSTLREVAQRLAAEHGCGGWREWTVSPTTGHATLGYGRAIVSLTSGESFDVGDYHVDGMNRPRLKECEPIPVTVAATPNASAFPRWQREMVVWPDEDLDRCANGCVCTPEERAANE